MPISALVAIIGVGIATISIQIRLFGVLKTDIRSLATEFRGDLHNLNGRIDRAEEKLSSRIGQVEERLNGRIDQVEEKLSHRIDQVSSEVKDVGSEVTFMKGQLSTALAFLQPHQKPEAAASTPPDRPGVYGSWPKDHSMHDAPWHQGERTTDDQCTDNINITSDLVYRLKNSWPDQQELHNT